jgi:alkylation response protein AidB-like acyl-CoA dehydrogenase
MSAVNQIQDSTEDIRAFSDTARDFAERELLDKREQNDRYPFGELFVESIKKAGDLGFYTINLPAAYGGMDVREAAIASILENLSIVDASMAAIVLTNAAALEVIRCASLEADCGAIYRRLVDADALPLAFHCYTALGEMEPPSVDAAHATISGRMSFLSLGEIARYGLIPARSPNDGLSYYLVDLGDKGVQKSETVYSIGLHACPAIDVVFDGAAGQLVGEPDKATQYFRDMQSRLSIGAAAIALGIMKGSFYEALQYTKDRRQGGRPIIEWSEVKMLLANIAIETRIGQSCLATACREIESNRVGWETTARATAIHVAEMACRATVDGVQLLGGNGYMKDYGQEKRMRDAKQVQCLLGMAPVRKIDLIDRVIDWGP